MITDLGPQPVFIIVPALALIVSALGVAILIAYFRVRRDSGRYKIIGSTDYNHEGMAWAGAIIAFVGGCLTLTSIVLLIPYQPQYWMLTEHQGTIATVSNRFIEGTGDVGGASYTLTLEGDPTPLVVTDSRVLGLTVGQDIDLTCTLEWVYGGADKSNCYMRSF